MSNLIDKINWPLFLGILAGLIAIFSAVAQWSENKAAEKENKVAQDSLKELNRETLAKTDSLAAANERIIDLQNKLYTKSDSIVTSEAELVKLYRKNEELQEELKNHITGGGNVPLISVSTHKSINPAEPDTYLISFYLENKGKYPLNNLRATFIDDSKYDAANKRSVTDGPVKEADLGTLNASHSYPIFYSDYILRHEGERLPTYNLGVSWTGGTIGCFLRMKFERGKMIPDLVSIFLNGRHVSKNQYFHFEII